MSVQPSLVLPYGFTTLSDAGIALVRTAMSNRISVRLRPIRFRLYTAEKGSKCISSCSKYRRLGPVSVLTDCGMSGSGFSGGER